MILECPAATPIAVGDYPEFDVIIRSSVSLERNLEGLPFPHHIGNEQRTRLNGQLVSCARASGIGTARIGDLDPWFKSNLVERELFSRTYVLEDEAFVALNPVAGSWIAFNDSNHVSVRGASPGLDLDAVLDEVFAVEASYSRALGESCWAFEADIGFIVSDAAQCGSGLASSVTLHAPALVLSGLAEPAFKRAMDAGFTVTGAYSVTEASAGSLFELSLPGIHRDPERVAVGRLAAAARALAEYERRARVQMLEHKPWEILDVIGRAMGLAVGARLISRGEVTDIVSGLRLGVACGVLEGLELATVTDLWPSSRTRAPVAEGGIDDEPEYSLRARNLRASVRNVRFNERYRDV